MNELATFNEHFNSCHIPESRFAIILSSEMTWSFHLVNVNCWSNLYMVWLDVTVFCSLCSLLRWPSRCLAYSLVSQTPFFTLSLSSDGARELWGQLPLHSSSSSPTHLPASRGLILVCQVYRREVIVKLNVQAHVEGSASRFGRVSNTKCLHYLLHRTPPVPQLVSTLWVKGNPMYMTVCLSSPTIAVRQPQLFVEPKGLWQWYVTLRNAGFVDLSIFRNSK
jgi:hypothetical protein